MDFITWWLDEHWFWSTVLTPAITFAWCCYKGLLLRGIIAFFLSGFITFSMTTRRS